MRPETALVVKKIIEEHFNNICAAFNVPPDQEAYRNQLLDRIRESFPNRDPEFSLTIFLDFWENLIEASKSLDQEERWGENPYAALEDEASRGVSPTGEVPEAAERTGPPPPEPPDKNFLETRVVLEQIAALGDCLQAIAGEKELKSRKQTFISLGVLILQVVEIVNDLLGQKDI